MKKQLGTVVLAGALVFSYTSFEALAAGKSQTAVEDGRQQNGLETGHIFLVNLTEGPYYVGDRVMLSATDVGIDGPLDTLKWFGLGEFELTEPGERTFNVSAATYFKNGKKAGLIHSTTQNYSVTINVSEKRVEEVVSVASYLYDSYRYTEIKNTQGKVIGYDFRGQTTFLLSNGEKVTIDVFFNNAQQNQIDGNKNVVPYSFTSENGSEFSGHLSLPIKY